jgi:mRNA interferase MazF
MLLATRFTMTYDPGDVLLLRFPFTDAAGFKQRPALVVLDTGDEDVVVVRITTQRGHVTQDVALNDWRTAGLNAPSLARLHKLATLNKSLVVRKLGRLSDKDRTAVSSVLGRLFDSIN